MRSAIGLLFVGSLIVTAACTGPAEDAGDTAEGEIRARPEPKPLATRTEAFDLTTTDGMTLQGRLDVPVAAPPAGGWPLVLVLEGSGAIDVDFTAVVPPTTPDACGGASPDGVKPDGTSVPCYKVDQSLATRIAALGMAVARIGKRGTMVDAQNPFVVHTDMDQHGTSTLTNRVSDVERLVAKLAADQRLSTAKPYLWGISEGTAVSAIYAAANPARVGGLVLVGPVLESVKDLYFHQSVGVQYDQLLGVADRDGDRRISKDEYASANLFANPPDWAYPDPAFRDSLQTYMKIGRPAAFETFDTNADGVIERTELDARLYDDLWRPYVKAVADGDAAALALYDDNSVAQLREEFAKPSLAPLLFGLEVPISLIVGKSDRNTPASQLDWFMPAARAKGRTNIVSEVVEGHHNGPAHVEAGLARIKALGWPNP